MFSVFSWFFVFFQMLVFLGVQTSLFSVLVGSGDLPNRPRPFKSSGFARAPARFSKNHVFFIKSGVSKKHVFSSFLDPQKSTKNPPFERGDILQKLMYRLS